MLLRFRCCSLLLITTLLLAGCDQTPEGRLKVYHTSGKVLVDGQPAEGVKVVLYGATPELQGPGTVAPYGVTKADGTFELTSYDHGDGAPAGEFNVTAFWPEAIPAGADEEMYRPKDRLKDKYINAERSGLKITVPEGGGELRPIEVES